MFGKWDRGNIYKLIDSLPFAITAGNFETKNDSKKGEKKKLSLELVALEFPLGGLVPRPID